MESTLSAPAQPNALRPYLVLLMGIAAVSLAAIFIRLALDEGVPPMVIAFSRLGIASLLLTPITVQRYWSNIRALSRADFILILVSGLFLAVHFASWVTSLQYTSVLISVVLVTTTPIWVCLLEVFFLKLPMTRGIIIGLAIALTGGLVIALTGAAPSADMVSAESGVNMQNLIGGTLALIGAITVAVYMVIGRKVRAGLPLLPYIWLVYGSAAILLLVAVIIMGLPLTGYSSESYLWLVAMAIFPQLLGHSSFNYVLGYLPATYVSLATQLEPLGSAVAALILFREQPTIGQVAGSALIVFGVVLATLRPGMSKAQAELEAQEEL